MAERLLARLSVELEEHIIGLLDPNEIACNVRLVNKATAAHYHGPQYTTVRLSKPVPHHALKQKCNANGRSWIKTLSIWRRMKLLRLIAASGDLVNLAFAVRATGWIPCCGRVLEEAAAAGHTHVCRWLRQRGCPWGRALDSAAEKGQLEACEWLRARGCPGDLTRLQVAAARGGHLVLVKWLEEQRPPGDSAAYSTQVIAAVAHGCDLPALQRHYTAWLGTWQHLRQDEGAAAEQVQDYEGAAAEREQDYEGFDIEQEEDYEGFDIEQEEDYEGAAAEEEEQDYEGAAADEWEQDYEGAAAEREQDYEGVAAEEEEDYEGFDTEEEEDYEGAATEEEEDYEGVAAEEEQYDDQFTMAQRKILDSACGSPTPDALEKIAWLEAQGCPRPASTGEWAASLPGEAAADRLRWLRERGYRLSERAVEMAAARGNVAALQYLLMEAGVKVRSSTSTSWAADRGHLAALQLLHAHGCPLDPAKCLSRSAEEGRLHIVSWLADTFGVSAVVLQRLEMGPAASSGSTELVDWLVERGCNFSRQNDIFTQAAKGGCEVMLERLVELGCRWPVNGRPYIAAACQGDLATLHCLRRLGCPWGPGTSLASFLQNQWYDDYSTPPLLVLQWLVGAGCPVNWVEALAEARRPGADVPDGVMAWLEDSWQQWRAGV